MFHHVPLFYIIYIYIIYREIHQNITNIDSGFPGSLSFSFRPGFRGPSNVAWSTAAHRGSEGECDSHERNIATSMIGVDVLTI